MNVHACSRQEAADVSINRWASRVRAAIRGQLPETLVTVGVFTFAAVHKHGPNGLIFPGCDPTIPTDPEKHVDCRFPARPLKLAEAGMDFLDVHIYQADGSYVYRTRSPLLVSSCLARGWHTLVSLAAQRGLSGDALCRPPLLSRRI